MAQRKDNLALVAQFMKAMEQPVGVGFNSLDGILLGLKLIREESTELESEGSELIRQFLLLSIGGKKIADSDIKDEVQETACKFIKELADLCYVVYWLAAKIGIDLDAAVNLVHKSNMSKLDSKGKPIKRADGKILKGPNYKEPDMSEILRTVPVSL